LIVRGQPHQANGGVNIPQRAALVQEQVGQAGTPALHVRAVAGEVVVSVGEPIDSRTARPPKLSKAEQAERRTTAKALSAKYRTELLI
jgi:hypothetical protein